MAFFFSAKNETLALPAESKTPEVEKVAGQPVTGKKMLLQKKECNIVSKSERTIDLLLRKCNFVSNSERVINLIFLKQRTKNDF